MKIEASESQYVEGEVLKATMKATKETIASIMIKYKIDTISFTEQEIIQGAKLGAKMIAKHEGEGMTFRFGGK